MISLFFCSKILIGYRQAAKYERCGMTSLIYPLIAERVLKLYLCVTPFYHHSTACMCIVSEGDRAYSKDSIFHERS